MFASSLRRVSESAALGLRHITISINLAFTSGKSLDFITGTIILLTCRLTTYLRLFLNLILISSFLKKGRVSLFGY